jgi:hypothetical protein
LNETGQAGTPVEREVTIGSADARSAFKAGQKYTMLAYVEAGKLEANFAKLSFQLGIYKPSITDNPGVYSYCLLHGGSDPASCVAGIPGKTVTVTPQNYTGSPFSILAPTVPSFTYPNQICSKPPGYPQLEKGLSIPEVTAYDLGFRMLRFQRAVTINGGIPAVGCPIDFVHLDTLWWPRGGRTQDFDGSQTGKGKGAIMLAPDASQAFWVHGAIWARYSTEQFGGPKSVVGEPTGDEQSVTSSRGSKGAFQAFTRGYLYFNGTLNKTFYVANAIAQKYRSVNLHNDPLGFPVGDEYAWNGGARSNFEAGYIYWNAAEGAVIVRSPLPPAYEGYHDFVDCNNIGGWARDKNNPGTRLNVSVIDDTTGATVASGTADQLRTDLVNAGKGDGKYGFTIPMPAGLKDGQNHALRVKVTVSGFTLGTTPKTFNSAVSCPTATPTPTTPGYVGFVDVADCNSIAGWAADRNHLGTAISVRLYDGNTLLATVPANQPRPDVGTFLKDNGLHGFSIPTPAALKSGTHTLSVRYESSNINLGNSPKTLNCTSPTPTPTPLPAYEGYHDFVDCNNIGGWVRDKNNPNARLNVSVFDDANGALVASGVAERLRSDLVNAGVGDGRYGFIIPMPAGLKDGTTHSIRVKVTGTNFSLTGTPRSFNSSSSCAPPASPDLIVSAISGTSNVAPGGQMNVSATVHNQGGVAAGSFRLGLYFSTDTNINTSDAFLGSCNTGGLSAGASFTCSGTLTVPQQTSGTYFLGGIADDQNAVTESNEGNNTRSSEAIRVGEVIPQTITWEFNSSGNFEGWGAVNASGSAVHDGILFLDPSGSDPNIVSPTLSVSASSYKTVVVKMASNGLDPFGNIFFKTQGENFYSADKRVEFFVQNCALCGNASFITYTINMAGNPKWSGTITGIRIDPANDGKSGTNTDSIGFDFVKLTP